MKSTIIAIVIVIGMIGGAMLFSGGNSPADTTGGSGGSRGQTGQGQPSSNTSITTDGKQVVQITAKGGYSPRLTTAKADVPTVIKVNTTGTFDCSMALTIPGLGYRKNLPSTGTEEIELSAQKAGTSIKGRCAMGMYNFTINFI